ncbi:hypothetical protein ES703_101359 [subsurface metagenome]|uniref:Uncharacterized protein n=1 Tax=marine sediment metagenome TaxID=412755 RepID=X1C8N8_9ZZZZ
MAILEEQGTKANNEAVQNCSFLDDKILVALVAGAVQPKPNAKGINDFPGSPSFLKNLSALTINLERMPMSSNNPKIK